MTVEESSSASFFSWVGAGERVNRRAGGGGGVKLASWEPTDSTIVGQQTARRLSQNTQKGLWRFNEASNILRLENAQKSKQNLEIIENRKECSSWKGPKKKEEEEEKVCGVCFLTIRKFTENASRKPTQLCFTFSFVFRF